MITYNPAFDLYHGVYRMSHIIDHLDKLEYMDLDKVRIWDFYMLFPEKTYAIRMRRSETEFRKIRKQYIKRELNPYDYQGDNKMLFERIKTYQMTALSCLVSYGILDRDAYMENRIHVADTVKLKDLLQTIEKLETSEANTLSFLCYFSKNMSLYGEWGLKSRTNLLESRYDAK